MALSNIKVNNTLVSSVDSEATKNSDNLINSNAVSKINEKTWDIYSPTWRDSRRIYYNKSNHTLQIKGYRSSPSNDTQLCRFHFNGTYYNIKDTTSIKQFTFSGANDQIMLPIGNGNEVNYTLDDFVSFGDGNAHPGYFKIAHFTWHELSSVSDMIMTSIGKFDVDVQNIDNIIDSGIYKITSSPSPFILFVFRDENSHDISQTRLFTYTPTETLPSLTCIQNRLWESDNEKWTPWTDYFTEIGDNFNNLIGNPIIKNHTEEIRWRGTARLYWDDLFTRIYWSDGVNNYGEDQMLNIIYKNKVIRLGIGNVKERKFNVNYNTQFLLPIPSTYESELMTLDDIVITTGNDWDKDAYVKIAHITYGNAISSFIIDKEPKDEISSKIFPKSLQLASISEGYNYVQDLIDNGSIGEDGKLSYYPNPKRFAVFFKLPKKGEAPTFQWSQYPAAYQWYSGVPDYVSGSNSLGRTTTNTPPANATYGGLTFAGSGIKPEYIYIKNQTDVDDSKTKINIYGSNLNNSFGENCFANGLRTNLKILGYGNSFMRNSVAYLSAIAKGCGVNLTVGNLYTGGTYLANHLTALRNNSADYEWHKYVDGVETQSQGGQTPMRGLLEERWDAIIIHQYNVQNHPIEPTLNEFIKLIIEKLGYCPKIYINATWAYHEGYIDKYCSDYYDNETEMWEDMLNKWKSACEDSGIAEYSIIPTGTAIQNARTLSWADDYNRFVNGGAADYSDDWHHLNPAGGFIAACTIFQKIITPLNEIPCSNTTFRITTSTAMPPQWVVEEGILVTDDNYLPMCNAAIAAVDNPYVITDLSNS